MPLIKKYLIWISAGVSSICGSFVYLKNNRPNFATTPTPSKTPDEYIYLPEIFHYLNVVDKDKKENEDSKIIENWLSKLEVFIKLKKELDSLKLAQTSDYNQNIEFARKPGNINLNQFRQPIPMNKILIRINDEHHCFDSLHELMIHLLKCPLETNYQSECANYLTRQTLVLFEQSNPLNDYSFYHEYSNPRKDEFNVRMKRYKSLYFQSILQNITSNENLALCLINNGLLIAFHKLNQSFSDTHSSRWISTCISALSFYKSTHKHFYHTGWIGILAKWLRSSDWHLKLEAAKTLYNMAKKNESLYPSIYLLWPIYETDFSLLEYDIVFIHGLKGGVLKTWRQSDTMKHSLDYTECWPKSWLAKDFGNCRILAVHYDSFLSNWNITCSSDEFTIKDRSIQLINELREAGIGSKPIIWITHSMGGLFVKQMLVYCNSNISANHPFVRQTKGIVFYSVPHRGSDMAVWSQNIQRLISPSNHVLELRKDCPKLIELHDQFVHLARKKQIECLSFGETEKCTLLKNPIEWKALLVPEESANPGIGKFIILPENHFSICKPKDQNSKTYKELKEFLKRILSKDKLETSWRKNIL